MNTTKKLTLSAVLLALGLILPFFTGQIQEIGNKLLPMHIPVLICGFVCGWKYGMLVGFITPLLRCVLFSMPAPMNAICMAFELATYGIVAGILYGKLVKSKLRIYISLLVSMITTASLLQEVTVSRPFSTAVTTVRSVSSGRSQHHHLRHQPLCIYLANVFGRSLVKCDSWYYTTNSADSDYHFSIRKSRSNEY